VTSTFGEVTEEARIVSLPLSHVSMELGHLYMEDFSAGPDALRSHFARISPWANALEQSYAALLGRRTARISTCFLIDDYFTRFSTPAKVIPDLLAAAEQSDLRIDYLARESACATADGVALAELVLGRLVPEPAPDSNGSRPPVHEVGWLSNGERSATGEVDEAMGSITAWTPPRQTSARRHSVFLDVELWHERDGTTVWSCAYLAAIWQLLRLGLLRNEGKVIAQPCQNDPAGLPDHWEDLPPVLQLNPSSQPFTAYNTFSILASRFLSIEHAVKTILSQFSVAPSVLSQMASRSEAEHFPLPTEVVDRISYAFPPGM
jgi:hypothetical protein